MSDMSMPSSLCRTFASTLGGTAEVVNGVCTVTRIRSNLKPLIQGRRTNSALSLAALFSFESFDSRGNALNLGETVILQEEINPFISELRSRGIEVTALHNHWLFDNPRLMYIHFKSIEPPLTFANKVAAAFKVLTSRTVGPNTMFEWFKGIEWIEWFEGFEGFEWIEGFTTVTRVTRFFTTPVWIYLFE